MNVYHSTRVEWHTLDLLANKSKPHWVKPVCRTMCTWTRVWSPGSGSRTLECYSKTRTPMQSCLSSTPRLTITTGVRRAECVPPSSLSRRADSICRWDGHLRNGIAHRSVKWRARSSSRVFAAFANLSSSRSYLWRIRRNNTVVDQRVVGLSLPTAT